jgi:hypothetical protein
MQNPGFTYFFYSRREEEERDDKNYPRLYFMDPKDPNKKVYFTNEAENPGKFDRKNQETQVKQAGSEDPDYGKLYQQVGKFPQGVEPKIFMESPPTLHPHPRLENP